MNIQDCTTHEAVFELFKTVESVYCLLLYQMIVSFRTGVVFPSFAHCDKASI